MDDAAELALIELERDAERDKLAEEEAAAEALSEDEMLEAENAEAEADSDELCEAEALSDDEAAEADKLDDLDVSYITLYMYRGHT